MIRVCIGTEEKTEIPCRVLQHSIIKNTKCEVEFHTSNNKSWLSTKDRPFQIGTGFSLYRWLIPQLFDFQGHAIYLDADQLLFSDIKELWESDILYPNKDTAVWCTHQNGHFETSVMFIDCFKAKEQFPTEEKIYKSLENDTGRNYYKSLMHGIELLYSPQRIADCWNSLNLFHSSTRLLHYTVEHQQPWYNPAHPLKGLWETALREAIAAGFVTRDMLQAHLARWQLPTGQKGFRYNGMHPYWKKLIS